MANFRQAREVYSRFSGNGAADPEYPILPYLERLAAVEYALGNYSEAIKQQENIYRLKKQVFGLRHPQTAITFMNLADVEKRQGEIKSSIKHLKEALDILNSFFGKNHPLIQKTQKALAAES